VVQPAAALRVGLFLRKGAIIVVVLRTNSRSVGSLARGHDPSILYLPQSQVVDADEGVPTPLSSGTVTLSFFKGKKALLASWKMSSGAASTRPSSCVRPFWGLTARCCGFHGVPQDLPGFHSHTQWKKPDSPPPSP
jgi:hypothetical protein